MPKHDNPYLSPGHAPSAPPTLEHMSPATAELHGQINAHMQRAKVAYLHPQEPTVQLDLRGSGQMVSWQEAKAARVMLRDESWSALPQIYARYGTEDGRTLIGAVRQLENAAGAVLTDSGMQALTLLTDVLTTAGGHALVSRQLYNKSKAYLAWLCQRWPFEISLLDEMTPVELHAKVRPESRFILLETYTNPLMRALDPEQWSHAVETLRRERAKSLRLIIDNTIATPWGVRQPLLNWPGIDAVVNAGTKAVGGEDRDMWGYIASNDIELLNAVMDQQAMRGGVLSWRVARVVNEGLSRAEQHHQQRCIAAGRIAAFLAVHPHIEAVYHPSLANHPDHNVVQKHYVRAGSIVSFRLKNATEEQTSHFCDVLASTGVPRYALSFDGLTSKINHHKTVSEYHTPDAVLRKQGIDRLARLGVGIEDPEDIMACLNWALCHAHSIAPETVRRSQITPWSAC